MHLMYDEYVQNGLMSSLPTYSISQDHLEAFFSHIRARQGANDNPNVIEFKAAWRKLLCGNLELIQSRYSNVKLLDESSLQPFSNIYSVSSRRIKFDEFEKQKLNEPAEKEKDNIREELQKLSHDKEHDLTKASIAFAAKSIENKLQLTYEFECEPCRYIFDGNPKMVDCFSTAENLEPPCASTFEICEIADKFLKLHKPSDANKYSFDLLYLLIFREMKYENLYKDYEHLDKNIDHKYHLVRCIVDEFVQTKLSQMSKQRTLSEYKHIVRSRYKKATHFAGQ